MLSKSKELPKKYQKVSVYDKKFARFQTIDVG